MARQGGRRDGAGRKPGYRLRKTAADVLASIEERHPGWSPLQLLAEVATDEQNDLGVRVDAAKSLAGFLHPRPKPVELDADAVVELEARVAGAVAKARLLAASEIIQKDPGLAERLDRAFARVDAAEASGAFVGRARGSNL